MAVLTDGPLGSLGSNWTMELATANSLVRLSRLTPPVVHRHRLPTTLPSPISSQHLNTDDCLRTTATITNTATTITTTTA